MISIRPFPIGGLSIFSRLAFLSDANHILRETNKNEGIRKYAESPKARKYRENGGAEKGLCNARKNRRSRVKGRCGMPKIHTGHFGGGGSNRKGRTLTD